MTVDVKDKLTTRLFAGCPITSEIRMHLNQSIAWKHAAIMQDERLQEVHHHGKDFFGLYLNLKQITLSDLQKIQHKILEQLKFYCPTLEVDNIKICIFPQVFIA